MDELSSNHPEGILARPPGRTPDVLVLTSGRELSVRTWLLLLGFALSSLTVYSYLTEGRWDEVLLSLCAVWFVGALWRLSRFTRIRILRHPDQLEILRGLMWPSVQRFDVDREMYNFRIEPKRDSLLFFRGRTGDVTKQKPAAAVRLQSEYEANEFTAVIRGFYQTSLTAIAEGEAVLAAPALDRKMVLIGFLVALNVAVFVGDSLLNGQLKEAGLLSRPAFENGEFWRIWTSMFLHAGFVHVFMNMLALFSLGSWLETMIGWRKTAFIYLASGTGGSLWALLFLKDHPMVGASGAIFGMFGAISWVVFRGTRSGEWDPRLLPDRRQLFQDLLINFAISFLPFISLAAHFGGFASGWIISTFLLRRHAGKQRDQGSK